MLELQCSTQPVLVSALDVLDHDEIQNSNDVASCSASTLVMDNFSWASIQLLISCSMVILRVAESWMGSWDETSSCLFTVTFIVHLNSTVYIGVSEHLGWHVGMCTHGFHQTTRMDWLRLVTV